MDGPIATRRHHALSVLGLLCALLALPASGWASSAGGGAGLAPGSSLSLGPGVSGTPTPSTVTVTAQSGDVAVSTTGSGISLQTRASAILRTGLTFSGVAPGAAGETIEIERSGHETGWQWAPTVHATVAGDGSFSAVWHTNHIGRFAIRAEIVSTDVAESASTSQSGTSTAPVTITVYRPSIATLYGPGFYGRRTACGEKLTPTMIGVANRTLRCGTKVAVYWQGRTLIVPVIDRGPYANHADWDLTEATAQVLGIDGTETIGAVSLPRG